MRCLFGKLSKLFAIAFMLNIFLTAQSALAGDGIAGIENEECENAIAVGMPSVTAGSTVGASFDDVGTCGTSNTTGGVWYRVTGTGNTMTASTCPASGGSGDYDTKISVFCGTCTNLICVAGNDDSCAEGGGLLSTVSWCSQAGATYLILVHGFSSGQGSFELSVFDNQTSCQGAIACSSCIGDLNGDGVVNGLDLLELFSNWGCISDFNGVSGIECIGDLNFDGVVNGSDLLIILMNWGPCAEKDICYDNADCNDFNICTIDTCVFGECIHWQIPWCFGGPTPTTK